MSDEIQDNKTVGNEVHGDSINIGDIKNAKALAVGSGASVTYREGLSVEEVAALVVELKHKDQPVVWDGRIPYLGLTAFQESDAQFFFGRESLVDDLLQRVKTSTFIVIAGPSGSGKSSIARAGLFHALRTGRLEKSETWLLATMRPAGDPIEQLAVAMERATKSTQIGDAIRAEGAAKPAMLQRQIEMHLTDDGRQRCVLLVDQFEEIFTQTKDEALQAAFISLLTTTAQAEDGRTFILLSLRSDFVSHCARYPELRALMSQQFQLVGAMTAPDLAKAITLPALEVGAAIEPALVARIMGDMKGEPGALPLMSFALRDLFEAEKTKPGEPMDLTLAEYLQRGGIESALERHANAVFASFSDEQKQLAKSIFSKLIEIGQGRVDTRRTALLEELTPVGVDIDQVSSVVAVLAREEVRLVTTSSVLDDADQTDTLSSRAMVTIAHEKLIDAWPWLRQLVDENREAIALQNQISVAAKEWAAKQDDGYLYRQGRLLQVGEQLTTLQPSLDELSHQFIQASLALRQREIDEAAAQQQKELEQERELAESQRRRAEEAEAAGVRQRKLTRIAFGVLVVAIIAAILAIFFGVASSNNAELAINNQATAVAEKQLADEAKSTAEAEATRAFLNEQQAEANAATAEFAQGEAEEQRKLAEAQNLAAQGELLILSNDANVRPVGGLLSIESLQQVFDTLQGHRAWAKVVEYFPPLISQMSYEPPISSNAGAALALSPNGDFLAVSGQDGVIRVWDMTGQLQLEIDSSGDRILALAFDPKGTRLALGGAKVQIWNIATKEMKDELLSPAIQALSFDHEGKQLAAGALNDNAFVWNLVSRDQAIALDHITGDVTAVTFSPNGSWLGTIGWHTQIEENVARVWDIRKQQALVNYIQGDVKAIAFSPDGRYLASGGFDRSVEVGILQHNDEPDNPVSYVPIADIPSGQVESLAFSLDSQQIVVGSRGDVVRVWEIATLREVVSLDHTDVLAIAFDADGKHLTTANSDTLKVWDMGKGPGLANRIQSTTTLLPESSEIIEMFPETCTRIGRNLTLEEWQLYFSDEPYRCTCVDLPIHPTVVEAGVIINETSCASAP